MHPDLIIHNGSIATCDAHSSRASALAVWRDRICAVGADHEVLALAGPGTRVVDLQGRFVCPGFIDCHVHLSWWAMGMSGRMANLEGASTLAEGLERVRALLPVVPPGGWLRGRGWDKNHWPGDRFPTAADLDPVTGDTPVALASHDGHSVWVNSAAMHAAGITPNLRDPEGGRILRDSRGRPTGIFQEAAAGLIWHALPDPTPDELLAAMREALPQACALGLTGVHNCEFGDALSAVQRLRDSGDLPLRVTRYVPAATLDCAERLGLRAGFGDEWVRIAGVKAFLDGSLGGQTAAMLEPYEGSDNSGVLTMPPEELRELIASATRAGLAVALHAIGDRAVRIALDAFAAVRSEWAGPWPRHRLEHAQHVHPDDVARFAALGIIASVQPVHMLADIDTCERHVGARSAWAFPLRSLREAGVVLAAGSDAPVEVIDPLLGLRAAQVRRRHDGTPLEGWHPEQRLTAEQALRAYTSDAAFAAGEEHLKGSLEVGKLADFVVLSRDILAQGGDPLDDVRVLATVVGGAAAFDGEGLLT